MDILVRVPKAEKDHFWEEVPSTNISWWTLHVKPKNLAAGDYIYFLLGDKVEARAKVDSVQEGQLDCDSTGRTWKGIHVCWLAQDLERLSEPLTGHSITRGFKYFDPSS